MAARGEKADLVHDEWCKALTPSDGLRKAFHSETIDFAAFSQRIGKSWRSIKTKDCVLQPSPDSKP